MTRDIWEQCRVAGKDVVFPRERWGDSTWCRAIREKRTICQNEPSVKTPPGHIPMRRHISLPVIHRGRVIGLFQVANKDSDYDEADTQLMEVIGAIVAPVLDARLQRDRQERARQRAERELANKAEELARSNADLEQFAYVASHDLQEPLRMVAGYVGLLARRYRDKLDRDANEFIEFAVDGARRMQQLIDDLLLYSRVGRGGKAFEPVDSNIVVDEAVKNLEATISEHNGVVTRDELPTVRADRTQLAQLFQNLVSNAVKFHGQEPPRVHVRAVRSGDDWVFSVQDNGIGIDRKYRDRIFKIFQRLHTREEYPGTGIGLAVCQRIVDRHGGRIWFESEPGKGSTFCFTLPAKGACA
jgi:light-regulated signal transduction histidine kinase (bacteriophytochrome)